MNHFIISDSRKCIGCKACEVACVMAHNDEQHVLTPQRFLPRITVMKHEQKRNAITCRHCESAPCARSCPNDAIRQVNDSVQVDEEKCIGCKSCMGGLSVWRHGDRAVTGGGGESESHRA
ncbi:Electron transport protein hydN [Raoultella ornithinolytica]|nr:Electron transport protein hydN [Raoultella ornithinolytica]